MCPKQGNLAGELRLIIGGPFRCSKFPFANAARSLFFVFKDSLVDNGNNNYLQSSGRADTPPYRISQRFEARSCASVQTLLLPASGILNDTGFQFVQVIRMFRQLHLFEEYQLRVRRLVGIERTQKLVSQSIVLITVCGNDFVNNYLLVSNSPRSGQFLIPEYGLFLIPEYKKLSLAEVVQSGGAAGSGYGDGTPGLRQLLNELNRGYDADIFIYADFQLRSNPGSHGFMRSLNAVGKGHTMDLSMHSGIESVCQQRSISILGSFPSI
ncbi:hypothetical protein MLD38_023652 [Melastoma candidum]|uniref:Uncharacterized protein n=1 Tax=Melastoma candidum TaxID=119954 RepID=A0ACB9NWH9_9MYRT|nr:hypothetical protein MLD38_023652 [Melastoma candidum]